MKKTNRIGCVGLLSDLPLLVAHAKGMFSEDDQAVEITTELGWASIEAKLSSGQLNAANVPAVMPLALSLGKGKIPLRCRTLAVTAYQGEAVTLTPSLAALVKDRSRASTDPIRIGVEAPYTQANLLLQTWLTGAAPSLQASITAVPLVISQLIDFLKDGYIQGFCCSEPIGQIAVHAGLGVTVARSRDYFPFHFQSVVAGTELFCAREEGVAHTLATGLERARLFCAESSNHREMMDIFSHYKSSVFTLSEFPRSLSESPSDLLAIIGFEPGPGIGPRDAKDPLDILIKACRALPGPELSESELRNGAKRVFSPLIATAAVVPGKP